MEDNGCVFWRKFLVSCSTTSYWFNAHVISNIEKHETKRRTRYAAEFKAKVVREII